MGSERSREAGLITFDQREQRFEASRLYDTEVGPIRAFRMYYSWVAVTTAAPGLAPAAADAALVHASPQPARGPPGRRRPRRRAAAGGPPGSGSRGGPARGGVVPRRSARVRASLVARVPRSTPSSASAALVGGVVRFATLAIADLVSTNRRESRPERLLASLEGDEHLLARPLSEAVASSRSPRTSATGARRTLIASRLRRPTHVVVAAEADPPASSASCAAAIRRYDSSAAAIPAPMVPLVGALRRGGGRRPAGRSRALGTRGDVMVDFFGAPAAFPLGPFVLARAAGVPLLPAFCPLGRDLRYTVVIAEPMRVAPGEETEALGRWARILETAVRRTPSSGSISSTCGARPLRPEPVAVVAAAGGGDAGGPRPGHLLVQGSGGQRWALRHRALPGRRPSRGRGGEIKKLPPVAAGVRSRAAALLIAAAADLKGPGVTRCRAGADRGGGRYRARRCRGSSSTRWPGIGSPRRALDALYDAPAHALAAWLDARGPADHRVDRLRLRARRRSASAPICCATGEADAVVAGGYDILCRFVLRGFDALRSLTRERVRPFDRRRSGLLARRGRRPHAARPRARRPARASGRLLGHGSASDASHIAAPDPQGGGLERAIHAALGAAGVDAGDLGFRQRARHRDAAQRPDRDGGAAARARRSGRARCR